MKRPKVKSGEPRNYDFNTMYYFYCCDCGLCHATLYDLVRRKGKLKLRKVTYRDDYGSTFRRKEMDKEDIKYLTSIINSLKKRKRINRASKKSNALDKESK